MITVTRMVAVVLLAGALLAEPAKVAGKWNGALQLESVSGKPTLTFKQDGEKLTGTYEGRYGASPLEGTVKENEIQFSVSFNVEGTQTTGVFAGKVDGDKMSGRVNFEGGGEGTWTAERAKP